jgi:hypothetical protein
MLDYAIVHLEKIYQGYIEFILCSKIQLTKLLNSANKYAIVCINNTRTVPSIG